MESTGCLLVFHIRELVFFPEIDERKLEMELTVGLNTSPFSLPDFSVKVSRLNSSESLTLRTLSPIQSEGFIILSDLVDKKQISQWVRLSSSEGEIGRLYLTGEARTDNSNPLLSTCERCKLMEKTLCEYSNEQEVLDHALEVMEKLAKLQNDYEIPLSSKEIALNPETLVYSNAPLDKNEMDYLKMMLIGAGEKANNSEILERKLNLMKEKMSEALSEKKLLHEEMNSTLNQLRLQNKMQNEEFQKVFEERNSLIQDYTKLKEQYRVKCHDEEILKRKYKELEVEFECLKTEWVGIDRMKDLTKDLQKQRSDLEEKYKTFQKNVKIVLNNFESEKKELESDMLLITNENSTLKESLNDSYTKINDLNALIEKINNELYYEKSAKETMQMSFKAAQDQLSQVSELKNSLQISQEEIRNLNDKIKKISSNFETQLNTLLSEKEPLFEKINEKACQIKSLNFEITEHKKEIDQLKNELRTSTIEKQSLEEKICTQEDHFQILELLQHLKYTKHSFLQPMYSELEFTCEKLLKQSESTLTQVRLATRCSQNLKRKEKENFVLREMIAELSKFKAYKPVKGDPVDEALAEYLMTRSTPLDVPFIRQDKCVYLFGTRRVFIKLEKGKLIIRIGGGFMHIDEFVEAYTPLELEKVEGTNRDPSQKTLGKLANKFANEKSKGVMSMTPQKAAVVVKETLVNADSSYISVYGMSRRASTDQPRSRRLRQRSELKVK